MKTLTYYAVALTDTGKLGQLLCSRTLGADGQLVKKSQTWTGVTYKTQREARAALIALNCPGDAR